MEQPKEDISSETGLLRHTNSAGQRCDKDGETDEWLPEVTDVEMGGRGRVTVN